MQKRVSINPWNSSFRDIFPWLYGAYTGISTVCPIFAGFKI